MLQLLTVALASNPFVLPTQPVDEHLLPSLERPALTAFQDDDSVRAVAEEDVPEFGQDLNWTAGTRLSLTLHYSHLFNSEIDDDQGEFDMDQLRLRLKGRTAITDTFDLSYGFRYEFDGFNFGEQGFFGLGDPWSDIHTIEFNVGGFWKLDGNWQFFAGGVFRFARETGADWGDSFEGGGAAAISYTFSERLTLGGGLGIVTRLEDDLLYYPIVVADWEIVDRLLLTTRISTGWGNETGVQLVYRWTDHWDVGIGAAYDYQRFRLNDEGPVAEGVGEFTALPFYGFVNWKPMPSVNVSLYVGINTYGELEAVDRNGNVAASSDYGTGFLLGGQATISF
ncbi:MAG: hypothetical protein CMJ41_07515 [Phycisphaerae bacterium]|nr:hypothetical protein [Phycisphaerae bacterium]HBZ97761.1 hypothetical protein [Phycisphaerales bacterium]|tara:strand:- start:763 stop:1776 length:1014 start_codon:yes stop_codon:yes gene_type:complete